MSSKSTDGTISGLDYVMVVLVIGIVALSSLYFGWVLLIEMYRSSWRLFLGCAYYPETY